MIFESRATGGQLPWRRCLLFAPLFFADLSLIYFLNFFFVLENFITLVFTFNWFFLRVQRKIEQRNLCLSLIYNNFPILIKRSFAISAYFSTLNSQHNNIILLIKKSTSHEARGTSPSAARCTHRRHRPCKPLPQS